MPREYESTEYTSMEKQAADPLPRLRPKATDVEVQRFLKVVAKIQSDRATFFVRNFIGLLNYAPLLIIGILLAVGFGGNQNLYLALSSIQLFVVAQSFNKSWSFLIGTLTVENPFMTMLPNLIVVIASACRLKFEENTSLPVYLLELKDLSTAPEFLTNVNFWSIMFSSISFLLIGIFHLPRICQSYKHTRLALHQAGYKNLSSSFTSSYYIPTLIEFSPLLDLVSRHPERLLKNVVYSEVRNIDIKQVAPILREFHSCSKNSSNASNTFGTLGLTCDVTLTPQSHDSRPRPVLLYVHGGAWMLGAKDLGVITPLINRAARLGWVVLSVDYRLVPMAVFPDMLLDVKRALAFVRGGGLQNAIKTRMGDEAPRVEERLVVAAGDSAGGHLVNLMALTQHEKEYNVCEDFKDMSMELQGVIDMYGPTDAIMSKHLDFFENMIVQKEYKAENLEAFQAVSPIHYLKEGGKAEGKTLPKHWVSLHGTCDGLVPVEEGRDYYELMFRRVLAQVDGKRDGKAAAIGAEGLATAKFYGRGMVNSHKGMNKMMRIEMNGAFHGFTGFECMRTKFAMDAVEIMLLDVENEFYSTHSSKQENSGSGEVEVSGISVKLQGEGKLS